jgi:mannose-1-phosphate guanylyltransferase/phosphomannomutase
VAKLALEAHTGEERTIGAPVTMTSWSDHIVRQGNGSIVRTGTSPRATAQAARLPGMLFLGDDRGGFVFPKFQPAFDAMYAVAKILEMLAKTGTRLGQLSDALLPANYMGVSHKQVPCPWDKKGQVMRRAIEFARNKKVELVDGVKIFLDDKTWVLFLPDPDRAYFHVWAEAPAAARAKNILQDYTGKVRSWQQEKEESPPAPVEV